MKRLIIVVLLLVCVHAFSRQRYVTTAGNNSNDGAIATPWATFNGASLKAIAGDTVNFASGSYTETSICNFAHGVALRGAGSASTILHCRNTTDAVIYFNAGSLEAGNNEVWDIGFNGDSYTGFMAIRARWTYNISIHDCDFRYLNNRSVTITNGSGFNNVRPAVYATGNKFYNNTVYDSGKEWDAGASHGALYITGQYGFQLYKNNITSIVRTGSTIGGEILKSSEMKAMSVHDNYFEVIGSDDYSYWGFLFEIWDIGDGSNFYNNTFRGYLDLVNISKGDSTYAINIHDNVFGWTALQPIRRKAISFEGSCADVNIYNNEFNYLAYIFALYTTPGVVIQRIHIYKNLFLGFGYSGDTSTGKGIYQAGSTPYTIRDITLDNNTFVSTRGTNTLNFVYIPTSSVARNYVIRNNIFTGFGKAITSDASTAGSIDTVLVQNNCYYLNTANVSWGGITPSHLTNTNEVITNPGLIYSQHISIGSSCNDAGLYIGLPYYGGAPDIGYFESIPVMFHIKYNQKFVSQGKLTSF